MQEYVSASLRAVDSCVEAHRVQVRRIMLDALEHFQHIEKADACFDRRQTYSGQSGSPSNRVRGHQKIDFQGSDKRHHHLRVLKTETWVRLGRELVFVLRIVPSTKKQANAACNRKTLTFSEWPDLAGKHPPIPTSFWHSED